ncbi:alginate lyase family protein [Bauldia litoralis]|uniref:alginate lyase family protein n=1 Tax=Bauldia litoralis TaxID=665467 RepID=UPI001587DD1C|nr:alginate lyase family protein [Bauldia litoralis]
MHWTLTDPKRSGEDIKDYWELSRFDGLLALTLGWLVGRDPSMAAGWNRWLTDWSRRNPANLGVNWRCAQETSLRFLQSVLCVELLVMHSKSLALPAFARFVAEHCRRVALTAIYAKAQDNNHALSEAVALYVGGGWLLRQCHAASARRWMDAGRRRLERIVPRLVLPDGSFAQNSVNYHRLAIDVLSLAEFWRRRFGDRPFREPHDERFRAAADWLDALVDPRSGDAPNIGANDGARLAVLSPSCFRDFRPSLQLAQALSSRASTLPDGPWSEPLTWLGIATPPRRSTNRTSRLFADGAYARLVVNDAWCVLRLPRYRFRPSHCDGLHLDLWVGGTNLLRDAGSYRYSAEPEAASYFAGTSSHNTVQFDDRDQMPRISPFLFGNWLVPEEVSFDGKVPTVRASYRDSQGASHRRSVALSDGSCVVRDEIAGFRKKAVLRWRLAPADWKLTGTTITSPLGSLTLTSSQHAVSIALASGEESHHYRERHPIPVVEAVFDRSAEITTTIRFGASA